MIVTDTTLSPQGYYYRFNDRAATGERLVRSKTKEGPFGVGEPLFSVQCMSPAELRHIAHLMDRTVLPTGTRVA